MVAAVEEALVPVARVMGDYSYGGVVQPSNCRTREIANEHREAKQQDDAFYQIPPKEVPAAEVSKDNAAAPKSVDPITPAVQKTPKKVPLPAGTRIKVWWPLDQAW